ncbi:pentatricopeptide repeat-containing protein At2g29760, chloroplastic-like [Macadamia integrifolia]|uniref:pentatricopeptide repeat-containing protein At2g29760, chloroplastic-like n=1 Tax=Macadamia integrifolia TaxID=60698 RepID=UPI001C4FA9E1|nr:pentatricopeptide repeat-containing protein At2g29760, chloroplastic-like [Macadamia integrifolia]
MFRHSIPMESFTYAFVFKACARTHMLETGRAVHGLALKSSHASHLFVANTAVHLYFACAELGSAEKVFEEMGSRNIVTWNAMISGYVQNGLPNGGLRVFQWMWEEGIRPDYVTMVVVISACAQNKDLELGRWIHAYVSENPSDFESNINVGTALIDMYGKCKQIDIAKKIFSDMQRKDIGVWNALIGGYVFNSRSSEALDLFQKLETTRLDPDETTLVNTLRACANVGALDIGKRIHQYAQEKHFMSNQMLDTSLVDMYSKCGCINEAREVFNKMSKRDVMAWTSMIVGLAMHGHSKDALDLFSLMLDSGQKPDGITFLGVLSACSHAGLVDQGVYYFETMRNKYCIAPKIEHYGCMIDLFGRAGRLKEAHAFILSMEIQPNAIVWRALLSACRLHSNVNLAETAIENLFKLRSDHCGDYVLLSNIYASKGKWNLVENIRRKMEEGGIRKIPGLSLIEANSQPRVEKWLELSNHQLDQLGYR